MHNKAFFAWAHNLNPRKISVVLPLMPLDVLCKWHSAVLFRRKTKTKNESCALNVRLFIWRNKNASCQMWGTISQKWICGGLLLLFSLVVSLSWRYQKLPDQGKQKLKNMKQKARILEKKNRFPNNSRDRISTQQTQFPPTRIFLLPVVCSRHRVNTQGSI